VFIVLFIQVFVNMRFISSLIVLPGVLATTAFDDHCQAACRELGVCNETKVTFCWDGNCHNVRVHEGLLVYGERSKGDPFTCTQATEMMKSSGKSSSAAAAAAAAGDVSFGAVGIHNIGNTCYMNSVVQILGHITPFGRFFIDLFGEIRKRPALPLSEDEIKVIEGFRISFRKMYSAEHIDDEGVLENLRQGLLALRPPTAVDVFEDWEQADASDAFLVIVHVLNQISAKYGGPSLDSIFGFSELEETRCITCRKIFESPNPDSLSILYGEFSPAMIASEAPVDLIATLRTRLHSSYVNRDICSENDCTGHSRAASLRTVVVGNESGGPQILVVGLQRKHFADRRIKRITTPVRIPERLNLEDIPDNRGFVGHYRLIGIVHHRGGADGGHYISQFLNIVGEKKRVVNPRTGVEEEVIDRKWFEANDSVITQLDGRPNEISHTATMIVYERI